MKFVNDLSQYFTSFLDASIYIMFFMFAVALVLLSFPKKPTKKDFLWGALNTLAVYTIYILSESIFFALAMLIPHVVIGGILFTLSFAILPSAYLIILSKDYPLHKVVKIFIIVASFLITSEIGRSLSMMVESQFGASIFSAFCRVFPTVFVPVISYVMYRFNIQRFKNLPRVHVIIMLILSSLLTISAVWQSVTITIDESFSVRWLLISISLVELFVLTGVYYAVYYLIDSRHRITELEVQSTVLSLEKEALFIDTVNREELMKIRHDLRNQLSYTSVLLQDGKYEEADQYIRSLVDQKEEYLYSFSCSNLIISGIVNLELTKAKIAGKKIKFKVVVPPKLPFEDSDLLSLITNIVDNSIENFVPSSDKDEINVTIVTQQDYLRITCFNSVDKTILKNQPSLKTTKRNRGHGYGTKIIKNIAKKYEGYATFTFEDAKFVCDCLINMNHKGVNNA